MVRMMAAVSKKKANRENQNLDNMSVIDRQQESLENALKRDGFVMSTIMGVSMLPTLRQNRDRVIIEVPKGMLKKYDIALYKRWDGQYVLHRVIDVRNDVYVIRGDNTYVDEFVSFDKVKGVVTHFVRGGKMIDVTEKEYSQYVRFLYRLYPIRRVIWKCHVVGAEIKRIIKKT